MSDSIIQEIRNFREQHAASMNYDLDQIFSDLKARQMQHQIEGWVVIAPPASPLPEIDLKLQRIRFTK